MATRAQLWTYTDADAPTADTVNIAGYSVEAVDGSAGWVDEATYEVGTGELVVDTGRWIFGRKVVLPAGTVQRISPDDETVFVDRTKAEVKSAAKFDPSARGSSSSAEPRT
jgi:hypothetical protein